MCVSPKTLTKVSTQALMINDGVYVDCPTLRLLPYLPHHVSQYHVWMSEPSLLTATESDPLSLEEERENQISWLLSHDKLTFILLAPLSSETSYPTIITRAAASSPAVRPPPPSVDDVAGLRRLEERSPVVRIAEDYIHVHSPAANSDDGLPLLWRYVPHATKALFGGTSKASEDASCAFAMIGDCNLFLLPEDDCEHAEDEWDPAPPQTPQPAAFKPHRRTFEVEVMIAEERFRRRGLAETAVRLLMQYALAILGATDFVAKILDTNVASLALFQEKLGFLEKKRVPVFHEVHLCRTFHTEAARAAWLRECSPTVRQSTCGPFTAEVESAMRVYGISSTLTG